MVAAVPLPGMAARLGHCGSGATPTYLHTLGIVRTLAACWRSVNVPTDRAASLPPRNVAIGRGEEGGSVVRVGTKTPSAPANGCRGR